MTQPKKNDTWFILILQTSSTIKTAVATQALRNAKVTCNLPLQGVNSLIVKVLTQRTDNVMRVTFHTRSSCLWYPPNQCSTEFDGKLGTFGKKAAKKGKILDRTKVTEVNLKQTLSTMWLLRLKYECASLIGKHSKAKVQEYPWNFQALQAFNLEAHVGLAE